jgi:hypothetical protein
MRPVTARPRSVRPYRRSNSSRYWNSCFRSARPAWAVNGGPLCDDLKKAGAGQPGRGVCSKSIGERAGKSSRFGDHAQQLISPPSVRSIGHKRISSLAYGHNAVCCRLGPHCGASFLFTTKWFCEQSPETAVSTGCHPYWSRASADQLDPFADDQSTKDVPFATPAPPVGQKLRFDE